MPELNQKDIDFIVDGLVGLRQQVDILIEHVDKLLSTQVGEVEMKSIRLRLGKYPDAPPARDIY